MVASPRLREELTHWKSELYKYEINNTDAKDPFEKEHWKHMCEYSSRKILNLEKELYSTP